MLLLLREHVGGDNADVTLTHLCPEVERFLLIARFDRYVRLG